MGNSKVKILFVLQDLEIGGAEQLKFTVEKYIDKNRYATAYCCLKRLGAIGEEMKKCGADLVTLNSSDKFYNLKTTYRLYKLTKKIDPDLIHSVLFNANFHARIIGILMRKPVITEEQGMYTWKRWYHILIDKLLEHFTYRIIAASNSVKDFIIAQEKIRPDKIVVLHNCIDPESLKTETTRDGERGKLSLSANDFAIGAIGKLRKEKGHSVLLDAFKIVFTKYYNARLFIVGEGPLYASLTTKSRELALEEKVFFLGSRSNVSGFLKSMDLFVMPSLSEGLGIALVEAIFTGLPCVASDVGGMQEVARESEGVVLVRPGDPQKLADEIINEIERQKGKRDGSLSVQNNIREKFTPKFYVNRLKDIYEGALQ